MKVLQLGDINYEFHTTEQVISKFYFRVDLVEKNSENQYNIKIMFEECCFQICGSDPIWKKNEPIFMEQGFYREVEGTGIFYYLYAEKKIIVSYMESYRDALLVDTVLQFISLSSLYYDYTPLHAAAVGLNENGVIIMGNSGAGKTTIETSLLYNGFSYFSDDIVFVDSKMQMFKLGERIVGLRNNTVGILNTCYHTQIEQKSGSEEKLLWDVSEFKSKHKCLSPQILLFPEVCDEDNGDSVIRLDKGELYIKMIQLSISKNFPESLKVKYLYRLKNLAILCEGYKIFRKNIFNMKEYIDTIEQISVLIREGSS